MAKISFSNITNANTLSVINANFQKLALELDEKVLYRDSPEGESNTLKNDIDADGNDFYNINTISAKSLIIDGLTLEQLLSSGSADILGYKLDADGAALRRITDKLSDQVYVTDFTGVDKSGLSNSTLGFQKALDFCSTNRKTLFVPDGTYLLSKKLLGSNSVSIRGASRAGVKLVWITGSESEGVEITLTGVGGLSDMSEVSSLQLVSGNTAATGTALRYIGSATYSADRISSRAMTRDVVVRGLSNPTENGWGYGVRHTNCSNSFVDSIIFWGKVGTGGEPNYTSEQAIVFDNANTATPHPAAFSVTNCFIAYAKTGVYAIDFEGGLIRGNQIIGIQNGVAIDGPLNFPHASLLDNHINASAACVLVSRMAQVFIHGNLLYTQIGADTGTGINLYNGANYFSIQHNIFENLKNNAGMNAVVVTSASRGVVSNNIIRRANGQLSGSGVGVWLTNGSSEVLVHSNSTYDTTTPYIDSGTNNKVARSGAVANRQYESTIEGVVRQWGTEVVILDGNGNGLIPLPLAFKSVFQTGVVSNGDRETLPTSFFIVDTAGCTVNQLAISVRPNPGAVPCRVNWMVTGR